MRTKRMTAAASLTAALLLGGALVPATGASLAAEKPSATGTGDISDAEMTRLIESGGTPYVQADSPQEAKKLLDRIERSPSSADRIAGASYGPCTLNPSRPYLRKSSGYGAVGTKPKTTCYKYVTSIRHSTDLRYKSALWWRLADTDNSGPARRSRAHVSKKVAYSCQSSEETGWAGATLGTIVYGGKTYYARAYTAKATLNCGG